MGKSKSKFYVNPGFISVLKILPLLSETKNSDSTVHSQNVSARLEKPLSYWDCQRQLFVPQRFFGNYELLLNSKANEANMIQCY